MALSYSSSAPFGERLNAVFGCTPHSLSLFRITLGAVLLAELLLRFRFLHAFYSEEGTLPLEILMPKVDNIYKLVCVHCLSGSLVFQQALLALQCALAFGLLVGYYSRLMAIASWVLYLSLTLRNTWLNFILDRYFHYLLFYAMFLPLDFCWAVTSTSMFTSMSTSIKTFKQQHLQQQHNLPPKYIVSLATMALKLQVAWIYLDAGAGKYFDPLAGWTYGADPLPALDTYARHTVGARYLYALLRPAGLRYLTPTVVYVELLAAPVALLASYFQWDVVVQTTVAVVCSLHIGIAITVRNTVLLSLVACVAWTVFLPWMPSTSQSTYHNTSFTFSQSIPATLIILPFIMGSFWFETMSAQCKQSMEHIWSTLLHNRWNVFVGAEEYVTWEIAPGRLADGSVVDVWGRSNNVLWALPGGGAPATSTARPGRWRSFPYLAGLEGEEGHVLWKYLCDQWDRENNVIHHPGRKLLRFNFFMLQADVLPNMGFSATRKRLIQEFECVKKETEVVKSVSADNDEEYYQNADADDATVETFYQSKEETITAENEEL